MIKQRLPNDWAIISFNFKTGDNAPQDKKYFLNGTYPFIRMQHTNNLKKNKYPKNKDYLNDLAIKENNLTLFKKGSIILAKSGASIKSERKALLEEDSYVVNHFAIIEPENWFDYSYVYYYFYNFKLSSLLSETTTPSINLSTYNKLKIPLPPLKEQQKIAEILSTVDEAIEKVENKIKTTERIKKGLMDKLLTKGIGHTKFKETELGEIPFDWEVKKVSEIIEDKSKETYNVPKHNFLQKGKFPIVDQGQTLVAGYTNIEKSFKEIPCIVFGDHTGIFKYIDFEFVCGADGTKVLVSKNKNNTKFLYYSLIYSNFKTEGYRRHMALLREIKIKIPQLEEQEKIVEILSSIDELIDSQKLEKERLERIKQGLMDDLLTGKVRVKI